MTKWRIWYSIVRKSLSAIALMCAARSHGKRTCFGSCIESVRLPVNRACGRLGSMASPFVPISDVSAQIGRPWTIHRFSGDGESCADCFDVLFAEQDLAALRYIGHVEAEIVKPIAQCLPADVEQLRGLA